MLSKMGIQNFKAFKNLPELHLAPVTVLCGTNSCGKSTLLQSILLAKQSVESKQPGQVLLLNGKFVRLGTLEDIVFEKNTKNDVTLDFSFSLRKDALPESTSILPYRFFLEQFFSTKSIKATGGQYEIRYVMTLAVGGRRRRRTQFRLRPTVVKALQMQAQTRTLDGAVIPGAQIRIRQTEGSRYAVEWRTARSRSASSKPNRVLAKVRFSNYGFHSMRVDQETKAKALSVQVNMMFHAMSDLLAGIFSTYTYIGPLRVEPERRYIYEDEVLEIGIKGENAAYISLVDANEPIKDCFFYSSKDDAFTPGLSPTRLGEALEIWLRTMGIDGFKPRAQNQIVYLDLKSSVSKKTKVTIADVGFGVSQVLPIVLEGLSMARGSTLLLEQPEIHLHPNLQMQMADYLISLALAKKNVIVETHSDHIINRLVRRIVEDTTFNLRDVVKIYFINPTPSGSKCEEVKIDAEKGIVNWPDNFFDQTASEQEKTVLAGLAKRKARRDAGETR